MNSPGTVALPDESSLPASLACCQGLKGARGVPAHGLLHKNTAVLGHDELFAAAATESSNAHKTHSSESNDTREPPVRSFEPNHRQF